MNVRFREVGPESLEQLATWLSAEPWPFHARPRVDADWVAARAADGSFFGDTARSFWVLDADERTIALVRAFDLLDVTPLIDLRVASSARTAGVGTAALRFMTRFVFETFPEAPRLGGYTRHDNAAMRRVFDKCGFALEAYHRESWRVEGAGYADSVGYALLRRDWLTGTTTPGLMPASLR